MKYIAQNNQIEQKAEGAVNEQILRQSCAQTQKISIFRVRKR